MLKIPAEYDRDTSSPKFKDISLQLCFSVLSVSAETRELWVMNQGLLELILERAVHHKMAAVHGALFTIIPRKNKQ
jgi:hypothetical protein